jgi:hypothetical protein
LQTFWLDWKEELFSIVDVTGFVHLTSWGY